MLFALALEPPLELMIFVNEHSTLWIIRSTYMLLTTSS